MCACCDARPRCQERVATAESASSAQATQSLEDQRIMIIAQVRRLWTTAQLGGTLLLPFL